MSIYRVLMYLFPASFRAEYGAEICTVFTRRYEAAANVVSRIGVCAAALFEVFVDAAYVQWDILRQDLRYAARALWQPRGFTLTTIGVVAIGIGANTAVFSMIDHVLIRPLPFRDSDRLV